MMTRKQKQSIILLAILLTRPCHGYLCDVLVDNTWRSLREMIQTFSTGEFLMLCPFHISGHDCPAVGEVGYSVQNSTDLYIMCEQYYDSTPLMNWNGRADISPGCTIDCPGVHFNVEEHASLTLDGMTLRGSNRSAITVDSNASLTVYNSHFEVNRNNLSNGGAIVAAEGSNLYISQTTFVNNSALNGGAVYSLGNAEIRNCNFLENVAGSRAVDSGGGALFTGPSSKAYVTNSYFAHNSAVDFGPAILDLTHGNYTAGSNTGCNNTAQSLGMTCNGALQVLDGVDVCLSFEEICEAPTQAPGTSPTPLVVDGDLSVVWSSTPVPSQHPSQTPSISSGNVQLGASLPLAPTSTSPTSTPTKSPTQYPSMPLSEEQRTLQPSQEPSLGLGQHSLSSTWRPRPTQDLSVGAAWLPSSLPLEGASTETGSASQHTSAPTELSVSLTPTADVSKVGTEDLIQTLHEGTVAPTEPLTGIPSTSTYVGSLLDTGSSASSLDVTATFTSTSSPSLVPDQVDDVPLIALMNLEDFPEGAYYDSKPTIAPSLDATTATSAPTRMLEKTDDFLVLPPVEVQENPEVPQNDWIPQAATIPLQSHIGADDQIDKCVPVFGFEVLASISSYSQGTIEDPFLDVTQLERCGSAVSSGGASKLYYVSGAGVVVTAHTCSLFFESVEVDTQLSIYTSKTLGDDIPCASDLVCVTSNDDYCGKHSLVSWYAEEGRGYFIRLHSKGISYPGLHHQFALTLAPTPGGSCQSAITIKPSPLTGELEIGGDPSGMDLLEVGGFVWYLVPESDFSWPIVSTCEENVPIPARMEVFNGSCEGGLQQVETIARNCASGQILSWLAVRSQNYYIKLSII